MGTLEVIVVLLIGFLEVLSEDDLGVGVIDQFASFRVIPVTEGTFCSGYGGQMLFSIDFRHLLPVLPPHQLSNAFFLLPLSPHQLVELVRELLLPRYFLLSLLVLEPLDPRFENCQRRRLLLPLSLTEVAEVATRSYLAPRNILGGSSHNF